ncbi:MAG: hypothetical protein E2O84_04805 [Bacteroidetes bacterium]|nr:MAG: hypothetical protein E2O84_04805 [Bacteroidota bacterium]
MHSLIRKFDFVLGSGNAARAYVTVNNGELHELPLRWFSRRTGWALSPGYERNNVRFDRTLTSRCMSCHNAYPEQIPFVSGKFINVPEGISCERCHRAGALHVEERLAEFTPRDSIDLTIINQTHLSISRQIDVCQQSHTTGAATVLKEGRGDFDFRPGQT